MNMIKNVAGNLLPMTVTEGVIVNVLPNEQYEYLMTTKEVAVGYGISEYTLRRHKMEHCSELLEGKHFISAVQIMNGNIKSIPHNATLWTKRGIVRLGFFIKSERAKQFRNWAEELIICMDGQRDLFGNPAVAQPARQLPARRLINRLDRDRLIRLLSLTSRITDNELRISITNELTGGRHYGNN